MLQNHENFHVFLLFTTDVFLIKSCTHTRGKQSPGRFLYVVLQKQHIRTGILSDHRISLKPADPKCWQSCLWTKKLELCHSSSWLRLNPGVCNGVKLKPSLHPAWNLKMNPWKRRFLLETIIFRFHVSFRGGSHHFPNPSYTHPKFFSASLLPLKSLPVPSLTQWAMFVKLRGCSVESFVGEISTSPLVYFRSTPTQDASHK